jgi:long-subunit fatty acid transport protein
MFAQGNQIDAYTLSRTDINGTARSLSMGGAFGALGGDISVISSNPAGLGIYRSSEVSGSLDLSINKTSANWNQVVTDQSKTRFAPNNFGFSLYFPTSSEGVRNWNLGFSYNRLKNFNRRYRMSSNGQPYSLADYVAWRASNAFGNGNGITKDEFTNSPYKNPDLSGHWLSVLGYENFFGHNVGDPNEYQSAFGNWNDDKTIWSILSPNKSDLSVNESGHMDEYNVGFGMNVSNFLFLGASMSVTDIKYKSSSYYGELFNGDRNNDELYLENWLNTEGSAVSLNVGAIMNLQILRLGVAYNSPRWYTLTDYYDARSGSYINGYDDPKIDTRIPESVFSEYRFRTPGKWIFSGALILGQVALISADYELVNYREMLYSSRNDDDRKVKYVTNPYIKEDFTLSHTLKLGAEVKFTPRFAVRAGYVMQTSPMRKMLVNNNNEVFPSGTIPHFEVTSNPVNYYTAGLGYRFTPNFYMDLAYVYRYNSSRVYAFSKTYGGMHPVSSEPATLKTKTTNLALTLGYKF